jgi:hypothetical protein
MQAEVLEEESADPSNDSAMQQAAISAAAEQYAVRL